MNDLTIASFKQNMIGNFLPLSIVSVKEKDLLKLLLY